MGSEWPLFAVTDLRGGMNKIEATGRGTQLPCCFQECETEANATRG